MTGSQVLLKNPSPVRKCSFHVSHHFTLSFFNIFVGIYHPYNKEKRSNTFKAETPPKHLLDGVLYTLINRHDLIFSPLLLTNQLCFPYTIKWLSSENKTFFQSAVVHSLYFFAYASLFFFISTFKSCFFCGFLPFYQLKQVVFSRDALISTSADKSFCTSLLVFLESSLLFLKSCASSFAVVFCFRPQISFRFGVMILFL